VDEYILGTTTPVRTDEPCGMWDLENMTNHIFYILTPKLIISIQYFQKYLVCSALTLCFD